MGGDLKAGVLTDIGEGFEVVHPIVVAYTPPDEEVQMWTAEAVGIGEFGMGETQEASANDLKECLKALYWGLEQSHRFLSPSLQLTWKDLQEKIRRKEDGGRP